MVNFIVLDHPVFLLGLDQTNAYCKVASINTSCLEAPFTVYRLLMKGTFNVYLLYPLKKNLISKFVTHINFYDFRVYYGQKIIFLNTVLHLLLQHYTLATMHCTVTVTNGVGTIDTSSDGILDIKIKAI